MKKMGKAAAKWVLVLCMLMSMNILSAFADEPQTDLRINTDYLRAIEMELYSRDIEQLSVRACDIFTGIGDNGFTMRDVKNCVALYDAFLTANGQDYNTVSANALGDGWFSCGWLEGSVKIMDTNEAMKLPSNTSGTGYFNYDDNLFFDIRLPKDSMIYAGMTISGYNEAEDLIFRVPEDLDQFNRTIAGIEIVNSTLAAGQ